jgi:DNA gyrase/topoisomerase IV subunit A
MAATAEVTANGRAAVNGKRIAVATAPAEEVWVYVASDGAMLCSVRSAKPVATSPLRLADEATLAAVVETRSDQRLLLFSDHGRAFRAALSDHPVSGAGGGSGAGGRPVVDPGADRLVAAFAGADAAYYLLVTAGGFIKRIPARTIENAHVDGIVCCRVPEGDRIVAVVPHGEDDEILIAKAQGKVLRIETGTKLRPVPSAGAGTVAGVKLDPGDRVVGATIAVHGTTLLNIHSTGMALAVPLAEYPVKGRATAGVQSVLTDRPARSPAGELALIVCLGDLPGSTVTGFTERDTLFQVNQSDNPLVRRATNSRPFLALGPGDVPHGWVRR